MGADVLFWASDKESSGDAELDALAYKRGDVITIQASPWAWSARELSRPEWRIVRLPNVEPIDLRELILPEFEALAVENPRMRRMRRSRLRVELATLPAPLRSWLADNTRAQPVRSFNLTRADILAWIEAKTPRAQAFRVLG